MLEGIPTKRSGARRRIFRLLGKVLGLTVAVLLLLVVGLYLFLQTGPGRGLIRRQIEARVSAAIVGSIRIAELDSLSLSRIGVQGLMLFDGQGRPVIQVGGIEIEPNVLALLRGRIAIERILVDQPQIHLFLQENGRYSLLDAVSGTSPPKPPQPTEETGEPTRITIHSLQIHDGLVTADDPTWANVRIADIDLDTSAEISGRSIVELEHLSLALVGADGELIRLDPLSAHLETGSGRTSTAQLVLAGTQDRIEAAITAVMPSDDSPLTLDGQVSLSPLTTTLLPSLGLGDLQRSLPEWVRGQVLLSGPIDDLEIRLDLETPGGPLALRGHASGVEQVDLELSSPGIQTDRLSGAMPPMSLAWDLSARMRSEGTSRRFVLQLRQASLDDRPLSPLSIEATLDETGISLDTLRFDSFGERCRVSGRMDFGGSAEVTLLADRLDLREDPVIMALFPDLSARLDGSLSARYQPGETPTFSLQLDLTIEELVLAGNRAERLRLSGHARGSLAAPEVNLQLHASNLATSAVGIQMAELQVQGDDDAGYHLTGQAQVDRGPDVSVDLDIQTAEQGIQVDGTVAGRIDEETLMATFDGLVLEIGKVVRVDRLELEHEESRIAVSGAYDFHQGASLRAEIDRFDLALFDGRLGLPQLPVRGILNGHVHLTGQPSQPEVDLSLSWRNGRLGPISRASAQVDLAYGHQGLTASAAVNLGSAGRLDLTASARPPDTSDLLGSLPQATVDVSLDATSSDLSRMRELLPSFPVTDGSFRANLRMNGSLAAPVIALDLRGRSLRLGDRPEFDIRGEVRHDGQTLSVDASVSNQTGRLASLDATAEFGLDHLWEDRPLRTLLDSRWDVEASVAEQPLEPFGLSLGPLADRPVAVAMTASLQGRPGRPPTGRVQARLLAPAPEGARTAPVCPAEEDIDLDLALDLGTRQTSLSLDTTIGEQQVLQAGVVADASLLDLMPGGRSSRLPSLGITLVLDDLDVGTLPLVCSMASGRLDGSLQASGLFSTNPDVRMTLQAHQLEIAGQPPVNLQVSGELDPRSSHVEIDASDALGVVATLQASADIGLDELLESPPAAWLGTNGWRIRAQVPGRSPRSLGLDLGPLTDLPLVVLLDVDLVAEPDQPPSGLIELALRTDLASMPRVGDRCPGNQDLDLSLQARLEPRATLLTLDAKVAEDQVLVAEASVPLSAASWLAEGIPDTLPPVQALVTLDDLDLALLPITCDLAEGVLQGRLDLQDLFGEQPGLDLELTASELSLRGAPPADLSAAVGATSSSVSASARIESETSGTVSATFEAPWHWGGPDPMPSLGEGPMLALLEISALSTDLISGVVPNIRPGNGRLDGSIRLEGAPGRLAPSGDLSFRNLVVTVPGVDQRLTDLSGRITLSPNLVTLNAIRARDYRGTIRLDGQVQMADLTPTGARISLLANAFPMRQAGAIAAYLSARSSATATLNDQAIEVTVELREVAVRLPDQLGGSVQSLAPNPDILLDGTQDRRRLTDEPVSQEATSSTPIQIRLDATSPFWVRRSDFAIQMAADLQIVVDADGTRISGRVDLSRGTLDLMGKTFDLQAGTIQFDGGQIVDPLLNLVAVHPLSRYPGESVTITITGRLSRPSLSFGCSLAGVETESQIVALLLSGRAGEDTAASSTPASDQMASILSGLTAGVLTLAARNALGDTLPVISVQTGEQLGDVQLRAGFAADRLIPRFLSGIVTGMYVEGFVQTEEEQDVASSQRRTTGGVLIELYFPRGFLTSTSFQPPANWSLDFLWQP